MSFVGETSYAPPTPDYNPVDRSVASEMLADAINANAEIAQASSKYVLLQLSGDSPYANLARALECRVFDSYFQNQPSEMLEEYGEYDNASSFFLVVDKENLEPAGMMRIIGTGVQGLKSVNDLSTERCVSKKGTQVTAFSPSEVYSSIQANEQTTLDVATIAIAPAYGQKATGSPVVLASMMRALNVFCQNNGIEDIVAIIDADPLEKLKDAGLPVKLPLREAQSFTYLGAKDNSFMQLKVAEVEGSVREKNQVFYDYIYGQMALMGECELSFVAQ